MPYETLLEQKGRCNGLLAGIEAVLEFRFGSDAKQVMTQVRCLRSPELLARVLKACNTVACPTELAAIWSESDVECALRRVPAKTERSLSCEYQGVRFELRRITDQVDELYLRQRSQAIHDNYEIYHRLTKQADRDGGRLMLSELYAALKMLFGESSSTYDEYKSSFSFPFYLDVVRDRSTFAYFLDIHNCRDSFYFSFRRILDQHDPVWPSDDRHVVRDPIEHEFTRDEMDWLISYLYSFLGCYLSERKQFWTEDFIKTVPAQLIVFGYRDGEFFEQECGDEVEYDLARR